MPSVAPAKTIFVEDYLSLVYKIAGRIHNRLPMSVQVEDLRQSGIIGLLKAIRSFKPDKGVAFEYYARLRISGEILDSIRGMDWASRDTRRQIKQIDEARLNLMSELGDWPSEEQLATRLGWALEKLRKIDILANTSGILSTDSFPRGLMESDDFVPQQKSKHSEQDSPFEIMYREELREQLEAKIKLLPPRYQKVITMYYVSELTMKQIGDVMGINESRVSQIHANALDKLRANMGERL